MVHMCSYFLEYSLVRVSCLCAGDLSLSFHNPRYLSELWLVLLHSANHCNLSALTVSECYLFDGLGAVAPLLVTEPRLCLWVGKPAVFKVDVCTATSLSFNESERPEEE